MADPIADDLVTSLARPSANVTGTTFLAPKLVAKRLQLLRDAIPKLSRVAALWHPHAYGARTMDGIVRDIEEGVRIFGMTLQLAPVADPDGLDDAFSAIVKERVDAFILLPSPMLFGQYKRIVAFAANNRLPAVYQSREFVDAGGFMSYGANLNDLMQLSASYLDKLVKGAKPSDLPIEQPTKFEFLIKLKTAKELGLNISPQLLLLADEVIE